MKKVKKYKFKQDKVTKILFITCTSSLVSYLLLFLLSYYNNSIANFIWLKIYLPIFSLLFLINGYFPVFLIIFIIYLILLFVLSIIIIYLYNSKKMSNNYKDKKLNLYNKIIYPLTILFFFFLFLNFINFNHSKISYLYNSENTNKNYTYTDLVNLNNILKDNIINLSDKFKRVDSKIIINNPEKIALEDLNNISNNYPFLKNINYNNFYKTNFIGNDELGETNGITYIPLGFIMINYSVNSPSLIYNMKHELCHSRGIMQEYDAEYCAFLSGVLSENDISKYGAYLRAFSLVNYALSDINYSQASIIEDEVLNLCLTKGYDEICNIYVKNLSDYNNKLDRVYLLSYTLKQYNNLYKESFLSMMKTIKNNFKNVRFMVQKQEVDLKDIENFIDLGSNNKLRIVIDNNKKSLNEINEIIKNNENLFISYGQGNSNNEEKEKGLNYYLKPIGNKGDITNVFNYESEVYDYVRVTRLLLEYYDN